MSVQEKDVIENGANSLVYKENIDGADCVVKICRNPDKAEEWLFCATKEDKMLSMLHARYQLSADIPSMRIESNQGETKIIQSLVNGQLLSEDMYHNLPSEERQKIAHDLAEVMYAIHNLDISEIAATTNNGYISKENPGKKNTEAYFYGQYAECIDALGKMVSPETKDVIDKFLQDNFNQLENVNKHVAPIHNDIRYSNIFYDSDTKKLGVIDFGGCGVNDVYHDFASIGLPNSLGFECQKDVIEHYNALLKRDNKGYQISYEAAKVYSIAKMTWFAKMMHASEKIRKTLFPQSADGKIVGMEDYLRKTGLIDAGNQQKMQPEHAVSQVEGQEGETIQNKIENLKKRLPYSSPSLEVKTINELRGIRAHKTPKAIKQTTLDVAAVKRETSQNEG